VAGAPGNTDVNGEDTDEAEGGDVGGVAEGGDVVGAGYPDGGGVVCGQYQLCFVGGQGGDWGSCARVVWQLMCGYHGDCFSFLDNAFSFSFRSRSFLGPFSVLSLFPLLSLSFLLPFAFLSASFPFPFLFLSLSFFVFFRFLSFP